MTVPLSRDLEGLISAAESLARLESAHEEEFAAGGLAEGHAERLQVRAGELPLAVDGRGGQELTKRSTATKAIRELAADGMRQVRILESLLAPAFAADASVLSGWRSATLLARGRAGAGRLSPAPESATDTDSAATGAVDERVA